MSEARDSRKIWKPILLIGLLLALAWALTFTKPVTQPNPASTGSGPFYRLVYKELYYDNGRLYYEGQVRAGTWGTIHHVGKWIPYGRGKMYYFEGPLYYAGQVKNGWRDGQGTAYDRQGRVCYRGYWKNDSPYVKDFQTAVHTLYYTGGKIKFYQGEWKNGLRDGQGISFYPNGVKEHEGGYRVGMRDGPGQYYNIDGTMCYSGMFKKGVPYGYGTVKEKDGWQPLYKRYSINYLDLLKEFVSKLK